MLDRLAGVITAVGNDTVAIFDAGFLCDHRDLFKDLCDNGAVTFVDRIHAADMLLGDDENVNGGLRIDILECEHIVVFINLGRRDISRNDFTE